MVDPTKLISVSEAAKLSPYSEPSIRAMLADGRLTAVRIAGRVFLDGEAFEAFLSRHAAPAMK